MLLERLFWDLDLSLEAFAVCEVASSWRLRLERQGWVTVHFVVSGRGRLRMRNQVVPMTPGSLVLVPADRTHSIENGPAVEHEVRAADASVRLGSLEVFAAGPHDPDELAVACGRIQARYAGGLGLFDRLDAAIAIDFSDSPAMSAIFERLLAEQRDHSVASERMMTALMNEAIIHLFRRLCADPECPLPWLTALDDPRLSNALALILEHPERAYTVESLAEASLMSRTAFSEAFRERVGSSPMAYLRQTRMRRAAALLRGTDLSIDQVAARVGYASRSQFSNSFSEQFGSSPARYRTAEIRAGASSGH